MRSGVIAQKLGMTRIYTDAGEHVPVTVLRMEGCQVVAQRTEEKNGYTAVQLGAGVAKVKNVSKASRGSFALAQSEKRAWLSAAVCAAGAVSGEAAKAAEKRKSARGKFILIF